MKNKLSWTLRDEDGVKRETRVEVTTGKIKWHFQFTPHDVHDWDGVQIPVLVDAEWKGQQRKLIYWG